MCKPHGEHKENIYKISTKENEKRIKMCQYTLKKKPNKRQKNLKDEMRNKRTTRQKTINKMATITPFLSVIILNANWMNSPLKRCREAEWMEKTNKQTKK